MGTTIKVPLGITMLLTVSPVVVVTGSRRGMTSKEEANDEDVDPEMFHARAQHKWSDRPEELTVRSDIVCCFHPEFLSDALLPRQ